MRRVGWVAVSLLAGCVDLPPSPNAAVATVGERTITLAALARAQAEVNRRGQVISPEEVTSLLQAIVEVELLSNEARRRGLDTTQAMKVGMRRAMSEAFLEDVFSKLPHTVAEGPRARERLRSRAHAILVERLLADAALDGDVFSAFGAPLPDARKERVAKEAERLGYATHALTRSRVNQVLARQLLRSDVEAGRVVVAEVSEDDVAAAYAADPARFHRPAAVHGWVARFDDAHRAAQLAHELRGVAVSDRAGHEDLRLDFGVLPGVVTDVRLDDARLPFAIAKVIHELPRAGDVAGPVAAEDGYFVVRLLARRSESTVAFAEAREALARELRREARDAAVRASAEKLQERWPVRVHEAVLEAFIESQRRALSRGEDDTSG
ncbi:MAG: peptidylprolyl isomerase [Deltaproteobacteria bacterium]